jgi:hypothetical protein
VLVFIDNIVLLGEDERETQRQVDEFHKHLENLGIYIPCAKKSNVPGGSRKGTWFIKDPDLKIENIKIPGTDPEEARYLGSKIGPWKAAHCAATVVPEILSMVRRIR